ncbi:MAG TPA: type II secretion system protein [Tepidisphaeraceae bacterium]|jgi:type II secretion system protein G
MTFAINATPKRPPVRRVFRGFTLLELLLVIGIIGVLAAILLPMVVKAYGRSVQLRTQADLQAISTALEAYRADFGSYPPVTSQNSGAAVLGKALLGPMDAAHYYTGNSPTLTSSNALGNPPEAYASGKTYQAGDVVQQGAAMRFNAFVNGPATAQGIYVCIRNDTQANGINHTPSDGDHWWARFIPFDGNDGNGFKARLASVVGPDESTPPVDVPHAAAGKVYGPYLDVDRFKTRGPVILDRNDSPILYFPVNKSANPTATNGLIAVSTASPPPYPPAVGVRPAIYANDNVGAFADDSIMPAESRDVLTAKMALILGDFNVNRQNDPTVGGAVTIAEPTPPQTPYLLWTAGPDRRFGPTGRADPANWSRGDFYTTAARAAENQLTAAANDDVTNFR